MESKDANGTKEHFNFIIQCPTRLKENDSTYSSKPQIVPSGMVSQKNPTPPQNAVYLYIVSGGTI